MAVYSQQSSFSKLREAEALLHNKEINYTLAKIPADSLTKDCFDSKTFDCIISNPPFNFPNWHINEYLAYDPRWIYGIPPKTNANFAWLQHILYHLNGNGAAAVILPNSTLTSTNNQEYSIRRNIIESKVIEAIVTFPKGLFKTTQTAFCIWFIDNKKTEKTLIVDATRFHQASGDFHNILECIAKYLCDHRNGNLKYPTKYYTVTDINEIAHNDYNLSPHLYLPSNYSLNIRENTGSLNDSIQKAIAKNYSTELTKALREYAPNDAPACWHKEALSELYSFSVGVVLDNYRRDIKMPLLNVKTVVENSFIPDELTDIVSISKEQGHKFDIQYGDVFLSRSSETLNGIASCCVALKEMAAVYSCWLKRLRPKKPDRIIPKYAAAFFQSRSYRKQIMDNVPVYTTRININDNVLNQIHFVFPDCKIQHLIGNVFYEICVAYDTCNDDESRKALLSLKDLFIEQAIDYPITRCEGKE